jgi:hypothetical protein
VLTFQQTGPVAGSRFKSMTREEIQNFKDLCTRIISEKNQARYVELVRQLDGIMDAKEQRLLDQANWLDRERGQVA